MRQTLGLYQRGFSVLELVLTLTLLLAVAAICVPGPMSEPVSKEQRAAIQGCRSINFSLREYERDTGDALTELSVKRSIRWLRGPGIDPQFNEHPGGLPTELEWLVSVDKFGANEKWGGPYIDDLAPDPWGRRYIILLANPNAEDNRNRSWIVSAGPDGVVDTAMVDSMPSGDDLGILLD